MDAPPSVSLCPNCGDFAEIDEVTGFCVPCSKPRTGSSQNYTGIQKQEQALAANADAIEHYLNNGEATTTWKALALARQDRAVCIVCGREIAHAPRNAVFCRRDKECRRYSRRYIYLYAEKGMSKVEALATIMCELT